MIVVTFHTIMACAAGTPLLRRVASGADLDTGDHHFVTISGGE
jgi:hypothetical protein